MYALSTHPDPLAETLKQRSSTPQRWKRLGRIFQVNGQFPWMASHTAVPIALLLPDGSHRIYFGTRDADNRPRIGYLELNLERPNEILALSPKPVLSPGPAGFFDDNGVYPGPILAVANDGASFTPGDEVSPRREIGGDLLDNRLIMYFLGRSNDTPPLYYMAIGMAVSEDGGQSFQRVSPAPILGRSEHDPWMVSTPWVMQEKDLWRMWYLSGIGWEGNTSFYHIKYAESVDGRHWLRNGHVCIPLQAGETNIACPSVLKDTLGYRMWYSSVTHGQGYRLGYAESVDGLNWQRLDNRIQLEGNDDEHGHGWDSQSISYPFVFSHHNKLYMLYSGNEFGKGGIGLAVLEEERA